MFVTVRPRASSRQPMEAAASPLPRDDRTPPVMNMNFVRMQSTFRVSLVYLVYLVCLVYQVRKGGIGYRGSGIGKEEESI